MRFTFCFSRSCNPYPISFALRSRPCCPGAKFLFSIPQEGLKHLSPLRKSFIPSLRHNLHTGPMYLANLNSPSLRRTAAVVGNRCHVADCAHFESGSLQGADGGIASGPGALHVDFERAHSGFTRPVRRGQSGLLGGEWRSFPGTFEAKRARAGPAHDVSFQVGNGHGRVVERRLDVRHACRNDSLFLLLCTLFLGLTCHFFSNSNRSYVFAEAFLRTAIAPRRGPLRVRALVWVRWPRTGRPRR